jgi:hypothetical protein
MLHVSVDESGIRGGARRVHQTFTPAINCGGLFSYGNATRITQIDAPQIATPPE